MIQWFFDLALQGVSRAGLKQGMDDSRSSLCKHFFRLFDQAMEEGKQPWLDSNPSPYAFTIAHTHPFILNLGFVFSLHY